MRVLGVLIVSLLFSSAVIAAEAAPFKVSDVLTQQQEIRADVMAGKGRYATMPATKRDALLAKQDQLTSLLAGKQTSADLTEDQYMKAFSALEWIETAINNQDEERLVCTREKALGSTRTTRTCRTVAQMELEREKAREQLDQNNAHNRR